MQSEKNVGICHYKTSTHAFTGILRRRFSDFRVTELDLNGVAAVLTNQDLPKGQYHEDDNKTYNSVDAIVEEYKSMFPEYESCGKDLQNFLEQLVENPRKECQPVVLKVTDDKDKRRKFHTMFRNCPFLPSIETHANHPKYDTTGNDDSNPDQHTITVMKKRSNKAKGNPGKPIRRAREPWPGGKQYKYVKCVMKKINMDCATALNRISRMLYISPKVLSVAGSKDKRAITSQWITAYQVHPNRLVNVTKALSPQLEFGNFEYCAQTLGLGDLSGNVFEIVLRGISSTENHVSKAVLCTKANGFINYFGLQRFGTGESPTHHTGQLLLQGKWKEALDCVMRPTSETRSDAREVLMSYINTGDIDEALKRLPRSFHAERTVLEVLKKKGNTEENYPEALLALPKASRNLYIHAFQAYVWNSVLSERIELYGIDTLVEGDLVLPRDQIGELKRKRKREQDVATPSVDGMEPIVVAQDDIDSGKYGIQDLVLPLPGSSVRYPQNLTGSLYEKYMAAVNDESGKVHDVKQFQFSEFPGTYRHAVYIPGDLEHKFYKYDSIDEDIPEFDEIPEEQTGSKFLALSMRFSLPSSTYATMLVREVTKMPTDVEFSKSLEHMSIE
ncbi:hypothetical protein M9434_000983 [Picochlorum sp. BPE23]|nr:hypothetical protein M9434_000983 [Picochlorum sp. BPE23]